MVGNAGSSGMTGFMSCISNAAFCYTFNKI
jgi:hypothetical protein